MLYIMLGALLVIGGIVSMAVRVVSRGRMSDPRSSPGQVPRKTLEPRTGGLGFLGVKTNWLGLLLIAAGVILMLSGTFF